MNPAKEGQLTKAFRTPVHIFPAAPEQDSKSITYYNIARRYLLHDMDDTLYSPKQLDAWFVGMTASWIDHVRSANADPKKTLKSASQEYLGKRTFPGSLNWLEVIIH